MQLIKSILIAQMTRAFGSNPPQVKKSHKNIRSWVENIAVDHFKCLSYHKEYLYRQSQFSKTWDTKYLTLIAPILRAFSMSPKVGSASHPQVKTFSVSKKHRYFHKSIRLWVENAVARDNFSNANFTTKNIYAAWASIHKPGAANVWTS